MLEYPLRRVNIVRQVPLGWDVASGRKASSLRFDIASATTLY